MADRFEPEIPSRRTTPPEVFFGRRKLLAAIGTGALVGPQALLATDPREAGSKGPRPELGTPEEPTAPSGPGRLPEVIDRRELTPREVAAKHNNFYEFLPGRGGPVWRHVDRFEAEPWKVEISGECHEPTTLDLDDLRALEQEERVCHFRCVERWAMNVPWTGFPLRRLLERVKPKASARYLRFTSASRPEQMPGVVAASHYPWPYREGLRLDEASHELAFVATGVYGEPLPKQHGAPVRIVVPWKYGFKNPKSIVKIELVGDQPKTFWQIQPHEYGFISNVNPNIPHPRWSQQESFWLDTRERFPTPLFNGYGKYVASLYPDEPRTLQEPLRSGQIAR
jgi:sulfoxide reductase catalytic subunit YedY